MKRREGGGGGGVETSTVDESQTCAGTEPCKRDIGPIKDGVLQHNALWSDLESVVVVAGIFEIAGLESTRRRDHP